MADTNDKVSFKPILPISRYMVMTFSAFDMDQFKSLTPKNALPELGNKLSVRGFKALTTERGEDLAIIGGSIGAYFVYTILEHDYNKGRLESISKKKEKMAIEALGKSPSAQERKDIRAAAKDQAMTEMRSSGMTGIKETSIPILICNMTSQKMVVAGLTDTSKHLSEIKSKLTEIGVEGLTRDKLQEAVLQQSHSQALKVDGLVEGLSVTSPISTSEMVRMSLGNNCSLQENASTEAGEADKEKAKLENFELANRDEVLAHLETMLCVKNEYRFNYDGLDVVFSHDTNDMYSGVKFVLPKKAKLPQKPSDQQIIRNVYIHRIIHEATKALIESA